MADQDTAQERTEEPTAKKRQEAQDEGQVPRSRELTTMAVLLVASASLLMLGGHIVGGIDSVFYERLTIDREDLFDRATIPIALEETVVQALTFMAPFFILVVLVAALGPVALGGFAFSGKAVALKFDRLDPIKGLKKIFGPQGLMELAKALGKFAVIATTGVLVLWSWTNDFLSLGMQSVDKALAQGGYLLAWALFLVSSSLVLIAAVDVPFQLWNHTRQLRMTKQEVKDEQKETDGQPEVKNRIKNLQREFSQRRMMAEVPKADVVVVNPEHYAVALRYDQDSMSAPVVVAKGVDYIALQIRSIAKSHKVPLLSAPALARALYHSTELNKEIPAGLYVAVAKVLAYIYQLRRAHRADSEKPVSMSEDLPIPDELRRDA